MDFTRKARWVLDGHRTPDPIGSTSAGVVSHESVRIAITYATLNGLQVFAADIRNTYLQAPSSQKDYIVCGPEFRIENIGKVALIHRALYGGKSAGRDFRNHLRTCMHHLMFGCDQNSARIPSTTPGEKPPRDAKDSGSARSHSMHLETSSSDRP